jgi:hypothetical protein
VLLKADFKPNAVLEDGLSMSKFERCRNPWNSKCKNTDIQLYVMYKGAQLPICRRCWSLLAEKNIEWGGEAISLGTGGN